MPEEPKSFIPRYLVPLFMSDPLKMPLRLHVSQLLRIPSVVAIVAFVFAILVVASGLAVASGQDTPLPANSPAPSRPSPNASDEQPTAQRRMTKDPTELRHWLESMVWYHGFSREEILQVTGLMPGELDESLRRWNISPGTKPLAEVDPPVFVLPYPGGRHPRIGFLDGAIEPQRETKLSIFTPWDPASYVVLDAPEALWSNLGLTYLAHTHIDTIWDKQGIKLEQLEWSRKPDGSYFLRRELPNKLAYELLATPHRDHLAIRMSLTNGTNESLSDLRVQMCAMLKGCKDFDQQTNDNKIFRGSLAACKNSTGDRWVILGFEPNHRTWGNAPCPCLHSDPIFPNLEPGQSGTVHGWLSFYQGTDINAELDRIEQRWNGVEERVVRGSVVDDLTGKPVASRMYVRSDSGVWYFAEPLNSEGQTIRYEKQNWVRADSNEFHTSVSAHPFELRLPPGEYTLIVERGKEYYPWTQRLTVASEPAELEIRLKRWINMAAQGWYSGDTHVHTTVERLKVPMQAEDVNVALPMVYWTTRSERTAEFGDRTDPDDARLPSELIAVDGTHVIWPKNTEWEIFSVDGKPHTLGALFALNHKTPFGVGIPPVKQVIEQTDREQAILDLDKHDWPFAMVLPPLLGSRLTYELANNHMWRTEFAFRKWTTPAPDWMLSDSGDTTKRSEGGEKDWIEFVHRTYWTLLNCGYRLQPSAGTASGVHPVPVGFGRVYVHLPNGFNYRDWIQGLREGRSFVTTGPMVQMDREGVVLRAVVQADGPIDSVEWIVNGRVEKVPVTSQVKRENGSYAITIERRGKFESTSWVAVRIWQQPSAGRWRFAHSAPVWFDVPGKPIAPTDREREYLVERVEVELKRSRGVLSAEGVAEYEEALEAYRKGVPVDVRRGGLETQRHGGTEK